MSEERPERQCGPLRVVIDRSLCVGFGDCVTAAPHAFALDDESVAVFVAPEALTREQLIDACSACPVDALEVWNPDGTRVVP